MSRVVIYLGRLMALALGYIAAVFTASICFNLLTIGAMGWMPEEIPYVAAGSLAIVIPYMAVFIGHFAFLPALPIILAAELTARRDWLSYALCGGLVALVVIGIFWFNTLDGRARQDLHVAAIIIASGVVGGLAYWLVAGRNAARWMDRAAA